MLFFLEENGVFIKTTDDTTTDNYIAQGMYAYMCVHLYISGQNGIQQKGRKKRDCHDSLLKNTFHIK